MNWHAVAVAAFSFIAFGAFFCLIGCMVTAEECSSHIAKRFAVAMSILLLVDVFLAGVVWA